MFVTTAITDKKSNHGDSNVPSNYVSENKQTHCIVINNEVEQKNCEKPVCYDTIQGKRRKAFLHLEAPP